MVGKNPHLSTLSPYQALKLYPNWVKVATLAKKTARFALGLAFYG